MASQVTLTEKRKKAYTLQGSTHDFFIALGAMDVDVHVVSQSDVTLPVHAMDFLKTSCKKLLCP